MMVCLSCYQASKGDSVYCGGCGRTFGKFCGNGHPNSASPRVLCCTTCGSFEMTEPTRYLNLSFLAPAVAGLIALLVWRWGVAHLHLLGALLGRAALAILALLLDTTPCGVVRWAHWALAWLVVLWLFGWMLAVLPEKGGGFGKWLRALPATVLRTAFGSACPLLRLLGRLLYRAMWPVRRGADAGHPAPKDSHG